MKKFKNFVAEEVDLTANVEKGIIDVHDNAVRNNINAFLNGELAQCCVTPYVALAKVNKVLANFHIFLPKAPYMENSHGVHVFRINQFNRLAGMKNDGSVVTKVENPYSLYFEWKRNEKGMYDVFAEVVTDEELSDLLSAVTSDMNDVENDREEKLDEGRVKDFLKKTIKKVKDAVKANQTSGRYGNYDPDGDLKEENKSTRLLKSIGDKLAAKTAKSEKERQELITKNKKNNPERYVDRTKGMKQTNWRGLREDRSQRESEDYNPKKKV